MTQAEFPRYHPKIVTDRLILREITQDDTIAIFRNFSDPDIAKWFFEKPLTEVKQTVQYIEQFKSDFEQGKGLTWAIALREISQCIGTCGYGNAKIGGRGEIGFDLAKEYWGRGLMSEALIAVIGYGFANLKLTKVEAHTYSKNVRAKKLLNNLGFRLDTISEDSHYYLISKENWTKIYPQDNMDFSSPDISNT